MKTESTLKRPANHNLIDIFKELKFGRPAESQKYLQKCIEELTKENQKQINMKTKKKAAIKAKKRIRLNVECHSQEEKVYFAGVIERAKKNLKKK